MTFGLEKESSSLKRDDLTHLVIESIQQDPMRASIDNEEKQTSRNNSLDMLSGMVQIIKDQAIREDPEYLEKLLLSMGTINTDRIQN